MNNPSRKLWYGFVPNLLTIMNLMCGSVAVWMAINNRLDGAILLMFLAALFDFFDGFAARLLKVPGELGKQLDSLADMVSFGLLPGTIAFSMLNSLAAEIEMPPYLKVMLLLWPLLIPALSALRLAKFNIDERQTSGFIGLPTPANALVWASLGWSFSRREVFMSAPELWAGILFLLILLFSLLLVANLPMFALKFKSFSWKGNQVRFIFLLLSVIPIVLFNVEGVGICILLYILLSLITFFKNKNNKKNLLS